MKYGESAFDILYLIFAVTSGCLLLRKAGDRTEKLMGLAALILGCGDAFHLIPRVLNYFVDADFTAALGVGKLITSISMTVFYLLLYYIWLGYYRMRENKRVTLVLWMLLIIRVILCLLPQNGWMENSTDLVWGMIRNIPFVLLGAAVCMIFFQKRKNDRIFRFFWLLILLSFLFYIPVAVGAGLLPMLGMLMLPKTVCYILMITVFLRSARQVF
jgi:hypothetical protein